MKTEIVKFPVWEAVFFIGLTIMPFVFWPAAEVAYEVPRVWLVERWIELTVVSAIFFGLRRLPRHQLHTALLVSVLLFFLWSTGTAFLGADVRKSLYGNFYRRDGLLTLVHLYGLFLFVSLFWRRQWNLFSAIAISAGNVGISVWTVIDGIRLFILHDGRVQHWDGAIGAAFGQPNFSAGYLLVTTPFLIYLLEKLKLPRPDGRKFLSNASPSTVRYLASPELKSAEAENGSVSYNFTIRDFREGGLKINTWLRLLILILPAAAIGLTRSLAGGLGLLLLASSLFVASGASRKLKIAVSVAAAFLFVFLGAVYQRQYSARGFLPEGRERIFRSILRGAAARPLTGWGWANVDYAFEHNPWPMRFADDVYVDKAHSQLLEVLVATGVPGLFLYVIMLAILVNYWFRRIHAGDDRKFSLAAGIAIGLFVFHSQTNVISIAEEVIFWLLAGIAAHGSSPAVPPTCQASGVRRQAPDS